MNIQESIVFFKSLLSITNKKSENAIYDKFIGILSALENMNLTVVDIKSIEEEIDNLKLVVKVEKSKKYYSKKLSEFKKYLKDKYSFTTEGYYAELGMTYGIIFGPGLGMTFGMIVGIGFGLSDGVAIGMTFGMTLGIALGMILGIIIGRNMDSKAAKENLVLKTKV